jgi:hypothetical protein
LHFCKNSEENVTQPPDQLYFWCCLNPAERDILRNLTDFWRLSSDLIPKTYFDNLWNALVPDESKEERKVVFLEYYPLVAGTEEGDEGDVDVYYFEPREFWATCSEWIADPSSFCPEPCFILRYSS